MRDTQSDDTAVQILVTFQDGYQYLAKRVKQALDPVDYPVQIRRERWGFNPDQYLAVLRLCDQMGQDNNVVRYDIARMRSEIKKQPEVQHRDLTSREVEKHIGNEITEHVLSELDGLL